MFKMLKWPEKLVQRKKIGISNLQKQSFNFENKLKIW